jgi:hypothetical protein
MKTWASALAIVAVLGLAHAPAFSAAATQDSNGAGFDPNNTSGPATAGSSSDSGGDVLSPPSQNEVGGPHAPPAPSRGLPSLPAPPPVITTMPIGPVPRCCRK